MLQHNARPDTLLVFKKSKRLIEGCKQRFGVSLVGFVDTNGKLVNLREARTTLMVTRTPEF